MAGKRALAYVRVSTPAQVAQGNSLDDQVRTIQGFADDHNLALVGTYREEGESGFDLQRPQLDALREEVRRGEVDVVVVRNLDRLTRSDRDLLVLLEEFDEHGVGLVTTDDLFHNKRGLDSRTDRWALEMAATFAGWQRERISYATKVAHERLLASGRATNRDMYGFDKESDGSLVPNRAELDTVALIREFNQAGASDNAIARHLNSEGIRGKRGGAWQSKTVRDKLRLLETHAQLYDAALDLPDE